MEYTRLTNLEVTGHLKVAGQEVTPGGGGGGGGLVVHQTKGESGVYTLDKTWQEIANALLTGPVLLVYEDEYSGRTYSLLAYYVDPNDNYTVDFADQLFFTTESPSGYPRYIPD